MTDLERHAPLEVPSELYEPKSVKTYVHLCSHPSTVDIKTHALFLEPQTENTCPSEQRAQTARD